MEECESISTIYFLLGTWNHMIFIEPVIQELQFSFCWRILLLIRILKCIQLMDDFSLYTWNAEPFCCFIHFLWYHSFTTPSNSIFHYPFHDLIVLPLFMKGCDSVISMIPLISVLHYQPIHTQWAEIRN